MSTRPKKSVDELVREYVYRIHGHPDDDAESAIETTWRAVRKGTEQDYLSGFSARDAEVLDLRTQNAHLRGALEVAEKSLELLRDSGAPEFLEQALAAIKAKHGLEG